MTRSKTEILNHIISIILENYDTITEGLDLNGDTDLSIVLDSLDLIELIVLLEKEFKFRYTGNLKGITLYQLAEYVYERGTF